MHQPRARIESLTGLRFLAAIGVVLMHFSDRLGLQSLHGLVVLAGSTVPLFFVLSGFVLTLQYDADFGRADAAARRATQRRYTVARLARIAPLYLGCLLLTLAAYLASDWRLSLGGDATTPHKALGFTLNALALQAWVPDFAIQQFWNAPAWSVSGEAFFYALLPALLTWRAGRGGPGGSAQAIAFAVGLGALASTAYVALTAALGLQDPLWTAYGSRLPLLGLPAFLLGVVLARRHGQRAHADSAARRARWPVLLLLASAGLLEAADAPAFVAYLTTQCLWVPLYGWLVYALARPRSRLGALLATRPLVLLGDASYALYLIHWLGLALLLKGWLPGPPVAAWATVAALVLVSVLLHLLYEAPLRRWILRALTARRPER